MIVFYNEDRWQFKNNLEITIFTHGLYATVASKPTADPAEMQTLILDNQQPDLMFASNIVVSRTDTPPCISPLHPIAMPTHKVLSSQRGQNCIKHDKPWNNSTYQLLKLWNLSHSSMCLAINISCVYVILNIKNNDKLCDLYGSTTASDYFLLMSVSVHYNESRWGDWRTFQSQIGVAGLLSPMHWSSLFCSGWLSESRSQEPGVLPVLWAPGEHLPTESRQEILP